MTKVLSAWQMSKFQRFTWYEPYVFIFLSGILRNLRQLTSSKPYSYSQVTGLNMAESCLVYFAGFLRVWRQPHCNVNNFQSPIAISQHLCAEAVCLQRTEVELISRTDGEWKYAYRTVLSLSIKKNWCYYIQFIAFIQFDASCDMHFYVPFNKDNSILIWRKESCCSVSSG